jgi:hypothetical protein
MRAAAAQRPGRRGGACLLAALAALAAAAPAVAAEDAVAYVTVRDRLMCRTQADLRDGLRAIDTKNKDLFAMLDSCHFSVDGIPARLLQDNINRIKIRLSADGEQADMWTVPEAIRPIRREPK